MKHDENHHSLITLSRTKELMMVQIWILPQLELRHEIYCDTDITSYVRIVSTTDASPLNTHKNYKYYL